MENLAFRNWKRRFSTNYRNSVSSAQNPMVLNNAIDTSFHINSAKKINSISEFDKYLSDKKVNIDQDIKSEKLSKYRVDEISLSKRKSLNTHLSNKALEVITSKSNLKSDLNKVVLTRNKLKEN